MKYLPRNRNKETLRRHAFMIVGFFVAIGIILSFFDSFIISAVSPLWSAENRFSNALSGTGGFFHSKNSLINENADLKSRIASLELEKSTLLLAQDENARLLELLGRRARPLGVMATVLTHPPQSPYDLLIVDAGSNDGLAVGASAGLPEGPKLGLVEEVFPRYARIKLFTTPGERTEAVLERRQLPVTLEGSGGGNFRINVPRDTEVLVGDRVLSSGLVASLLAVVEEVNLEATDSFKEVLARSPANIFKVRHINIEP
jgi:cell shape-determining protein MreC